MALPSKRYESSKWQRDLNDLIDWAAALLTTGGGVPASRSLTAGNGLTGGGDLTVDRTVTLGTPTAVTTSSTNSVTSDSHTHALTGVEPTVTKGNLTAGSSKITLGGTGTGALIGAGASVDVNEANLAHNNIGSLQGGQAGEYNHLTNAQVSALHVAATAGTGIGVSGQQISVDQAFTPTWTGAHIFQGANTYRHILPETTETYDLGAYNKLWRTGYLSSINATIFAENTQQLIGGEFVVPKSTGLLPAVASGDSTIDFGKSMTPDDHILIKSQTTSGAYVTEYIKVGSLVSGTIYNVTRDEASATTPDPAWPDGTPYAVLGQDGNGWIQLDATTTPRMSILSMGTAYNDQSEIIRLGDVNGLADYTAETYGLYIGGGTTGAYLTADPTNGLKISTNDGGLTLNADGLSLDAPDAYLESAAVRWIDSGTALSGQLYSRHQADIEIGEYALYSLHNLILSCEPLTGLHSVVGIRAEAPEGYIASVKMVVNGIAYANLTCAGTATAVWQLGYDDGVWGSTIRMYPETGYIQYNGALQSYKNSTAYTGYIYVPLATPLTSTSWDGDAHSDTSATLIDLSAVFGAPAGIKAVKLRVLVRDSVTVHTDATVRMDFSNVGTGTWTHALWPIGGDFWDEKEITVPCNANGDIYYDINASGASTFDVHIQVLGYYI